MSNQGSDNTEDATVDHREANSASPLNESTPFSSSAPADLSSMGSWTAMEVHRMEHGGEPEWDLPQGTFDPAAEFLPPAPEPPATPEALEPPAPEPARLVIPGDLWNPKSQIHGRESRCPRYQTPSGGDVKEFKFQLEHRVWGRAGENPLEKWLCLATTLSLQLLEIQRRSIDRDGTRPPANVENYNMLKQVIDMLKELEGMILSGQTLVMGR